MTTMIGEVVEQKVGELVFVLPPFGVDLEVLQDDQLSGISGGGTYEDMAVTARMVNDNCKLVKEMNQELETLTAMLKRANELNSGIIRNLR